MQRSDTTNNKTENFIFQSSKGNLIKNSFDIETLQKLAIGRKRSLFHLNPKISDHLNYNPPYFHEYWRPHPWIPYLWGSHLGRVYLAEKEIYFKSDKTYLKSSQLPPGDIVHTRLENRYMYAELSFPRVVYRIVAECWFYIRKGWHVHHINNNSLDCTVANLLPLSSTLHMAIHKPHKYQDKYSPFLPKKTRKTSGKKKKSLNPFIGIFHPRWKGFLLVYSGTVSQIPQFIFRDVIKFSKWFLETYSPKVSKGPRKGNELSIAEIESLALLLSPFFLNNFNTRISFWIPPLSIRPKWDTQLPTAEEINPQWLLPPTFQNLEKMKNC